MDFFSIPLSTINKITPLLDEELFNKLSKEIPNYVNSYSNYWLINTNLTVNGGTNIPKLQVLNVFLQYSNRKSKYLQITKK